MNIPLGFGIRIGAHARRRKNPDKDWLRVQVAHIGETEHETVSCASYKMPSYFVRGRHWGHIVTVSRPRWWFDISVVRYKKT